MVLLITAFELFSPVPDHNPHHDPDFSMVILFVMSAIVLTFDSAKIGLHIALTLLSKSPR